ncbi:MAG: hypothetical protein ACJ0DF_07090, partial [Paracoccaceae bacterium]
MLNFSNQKKLTNIVSKLNELNGDITTSLKVDLGVILLNQQLKRNNFSINFRKNISNFKILLRLILNSTKTRKIQKFQKTLVAIDHNRESFLEAFAKFSDYHDDICYITINSKISKWLRSKCLKANVINVFNHATLNVSDLLIARKIAYSVTQNLSDLHTFEKSDIFLRICQMIAIKNFYELTDWSQTQQCITISDLHMHEHILTKFGN